MIRIEELSKSYGSKKIFSHLSLEVKKGSLLVISGSNGCGKSSLLLLIAGLTTKDCGSISVCGSDNPIDYNALCSYHFSESIYFDNRSVITNIKLISILSKTPLITFIKELEDFGVIDLRKKVTELSSGMKQKMKIAIAICKKAEIYFFDEPTSNLDELSVFVFIEKIKTMINNGSTVVITSHNIEHFLSLNPTHLEFNKITKIE